MTAHGTIFNAGEKRPPTGGVGQDKGIFECARTKLIQPASVKDGMRAHQTTEHQTSPNTNHHRNKKQSPKKRYRKQRTIWLEPAVDAEIERIAAHAGLSFSMTGANLLKQIVQQNISAQQTALMQPMVEQTIRKEMRYKTELDRQCHKDISQLLRLVYNILVRMPDKPQMSEASLNQIRDESANAAYKDVQHRLTHTRMVFGDALQNGQEEKGDMVLWQS